MNLATRESDQRRVFQTGGKAHGAAAANTGRRGPSGTLGAGGERAVGRWQGAVSSAAGRFIVCDRKLGQLPHLVLLSATNPHHKAVR